MLLSKADLGLFSVGNGNFLPRALRTGKGLRHARLRECRTAFTLVEVLMGVGVLGVMMVSLYGGLYFGFAQVKISREDERATQILQEKMEVVRLLNWSQVANLPGYVPATFTASYAVGNPTNAPASSLTYSGTVLVTNAPLSETYSNDLRMIQVQVRWQSGGVNHQRQMTTFVSHYGLQNYVY
jgi:type II secretory pathway pseudopilin PulG